MSAPWRAARGSSRGGGASAPGERPLADPRFDVGERVAGRIDPGGERGGRQQAVGLLADPERRPRPFNGKVADRPARQRGSRCRRRP